MAMTLSKVKKDIHHTMAFGRGRRVIGDPHDLISNSAVRKAGWCPECKRRVSECECDFYSELPLEQGGA